VKHFGPAASEDFISFLYNEPTNHSNKTKGLSQYTRAVTSIACKATYSLARHKN